MTTLTTLQLLALLGAYAVVDADRLLAHARRIKAALQLADISIEKAALYMQMDKGHLRRNLAGIGHLSGKRLALLPDAFFQWFGLLTLEAFGLPREVKRAGVIHLALLSRKRMAKVAAQQDAAEQQRRFA